MVNFIFQEGEARSFFRQIVSAIRYIHSQGFCHRDLKPVCVYVEITSVYNYSQNLNFVYTLLVFNGIMLS